MDKYSEFFKKPANYTKKDLQFQNQNSKKLYFLMTSTENKSALDYYYWNNKLLYLTSNKQYATDFERGFQNAVSLSRNNTDIKKALRLFYLSNILKFSEETKKIVIFE